MVLIVPNITPEVLSASELAGFYILESNQVIVCCLVVYSFSCCVLRSVCRPFGGGIVNVQL